MKKYIRISLVVLVALVVLGVAGRYFVEWSLNRAFQPAMKEGGGFRQLADVLEASVGSTLARGDARLQPGEAAGEGALAYYQKNSHALQRDKKYFETWHSALAIADAVRKGEQKPGRWESSTAASWIAPSQRTDAWGHAFCVQSDQEETIVVSPGPHALSSLDCNNLKVTGGDLGQMPQGRLNPHASGALILFVKRSGENGVSRRAGGASIMSSALSRTLLGTLLRRSQHAPRWTRDEAGLRSNARLFIRWQENAVNGQSAIGVGRGAQAAGVIMHTRPRPVLGALDEPRCRRVEVNIFYLLVVFFNPPHGPVEKPGLPEKARLFSSGIDAQSRSNLDRFHYP
jgi:hypothetical protein